MGELSSIGNRKNLSIVNSDRNFLKVLDIFALPLWTKMWYVMRGEVCAKHLSCLHAYERK
jgi:hypothetical protein